MSKKDFVEKVTNMEDDFGQWYTDVVKQAELVDYGAVRGTMIIEPYGFAIWENIKAALDKMIKDTGHTNVYFPLFIPESLLEKEKDRKSTRLNSSHVAISYAVFCLKKKSIITRKRSKCSSTRFDE